MKSLASFKKLIAWSRKNFSDLPWRKKRSLYYTLVSEIMLQQTTVGTVKNHFDRFLEEYPDIEILSYSTEEEMLRSWKGLGYYRRAKNLRKASMDVMELYQGKIPLSLEELKKIKGIGDYTANALLAIGEDQKALALDANLVRVLSRLYALKEQKGPKLLKLLQDKFEKGEILSEMDQLSPRFLTEALMDLGREFCQARRALCEECPLKENCLAQLEGKPLAYPVEDQSKEKEKSFDLKLLRIVVEKGEKVLAYHKNEKEWLSGQWELPTFILETQDKTLKQYPKFEGRLSWKKLKSYKTSITKYKIENYIWVCTEKDFASFIKGKTSYAFHDPRKGDLSTASMKALSYLKR